MRRRAFASLALLPIYMAASALAAPGASGPPGEMREIFRLSGLEIQLGALDEIVAASLVPNLSRVSPAQKDIVRHAVLSAFAGPALQERVYARLAKVHDPQRAAATLRWLRSPLGRRITLLETQTSTAEGTRAQEAFAQQLEKQRPSATRIGLARELDRAIGATEFGVELSLGCARAAMSAIAPALPSERRLDPDRIEAAIASQRAMMHEQIERVALLSALFTYRGLTDTELETYIAFARSDAGQWYHGVVKQALLDVLSEQAGQMAATVASALRAAPGPVPAQRREGPATR